MYPIRLFACCVLSLVLAASCSEKGKTTVVSVKNQLDFERSDETVTLTKDFLKLTDLTVVGLRDAKTKKLQVTQLVDTDGDGTMDQLLFQPKLPPNSEKKYDVIPITKEERPKALAYCYSRFVPERTDDYTWENNKVAFRVYGPTAQKMAEDGNKEGTLSSGIDAWLKRVPYPIINKWYKKTTEGTGSYHIDTGEGLDDFHVGASRGVGGIAVKSGDTFYYSKNYTKWRTITTGPLRTSFYLEYGTWDAGGKSITESKVISLDLGSNLSKIEVSIKGVDTVFAGLTLHNKKGEIEANKEQGWLSYWEPHGDSELGTAIVAAPGFFIGSEKYDTDVPDLSNAYVHLQVKNNKTIYYSGFGWKKSGQFKNKQQWENYLNRFSEKIGSPLEVTLEK